MNITTHGPLVSAGFLWSPRKDVVTFTVISKLTLDVWPGEMRISKQPLPIVENDEYWNDDDSRSLHAPTDLVPTKPMVDVVLVGHAFAPEGKPVRSLVARMRVGELDKRIEIVADRTWLEDGRYHEGGPFSHIPLRYERAAFGRDNPVGLRHEKDARGRIVLPNLQPLGTSIESPATAIAPIGFGPIAPVWPVRMMQGRLLPPGWIQRAQAKSLPVNFDLTYFQVAPEDQRLATLHGDEAVELENLHPEFSHLVTRLPGHTPRIVIHGPHGKQDPLPIRADTLRIDTDLRKCTVTFRGHVTLRPGEIPPQVHVYLDAPAAPADSSARGAQNLVETNPTPQNTQRTMGFSDKARGPALPFAAPDPNRPVMLPPVEPKTRVHDEEEASNTIWMPVSQPAPGAALPFDVQDAAAEPQQNFPPPPPFVLPPVKNHAPQTFGEVEIQHRAKVAAAAEAEKYAHVTSPEEPPAKFSDKPLVKVTGKRKKSMDVPAKPEVLPVATYPATAPTQTTSADAPMPNPLPLPHATVAVELIHFDPSRTDEIRAHATWKDIVAAIKPKPRDADFKEDASPDKKEEAKNRREMTGLLARGAPCSTDELRRALQNAVDEDGTFVPPLVLLSGELVFPFDDVEALKATLGAVTPFASSDKRLKELMDVAQEAMQTPWLQSAGHAADNLAMQVREAFGETKRGLPAGYLASHTERILLEQRHYQKRTVLGQPWIRAMFSWPNTSTTIPTYVPLELSNDLPMFVRMPVRMIAEARMQVDQYETSPTALRVVVLGRTLVNAGRW